MRLLGEALAGGVRLDAVSFSAAASACDRGREWRRALLLLGELTRRDLALDGVACSALVSACETGYTTLY